MQQLTRMLVKGASLTLVLALTACSGEEAAPPQEPAAAPEPVKNTPPPQLDLAELTAAADEIALVPSPGEMQRALDAAGIQAQLADSVQARTLKMEVPNKDQVAVRTGVVLADLLLTVKSAETAALVGHLDSVKAGMTQLGAGSDIPATIDDMKARIDNDSVTRDDLIKELDELSGAVIPELEYESGDRAVPLIQAGSWLEGANLVAGAIRASGNFGAADELLKQPAVVGYFQKYVANEGADKAPSDVIAQLTTTLDTLAEICGHETLSEEDVNTIHTTTSAVLDLL